MNGDKGPKLCSGLSLLACDPPWHVSSGLWALFGNNQGCKICFHGTRTCTFQLLVSPLPLWREKNKIPSSLPTPTPSILSFLLLVPLKNCFLLQQAHKLSQHCKNFILSLSQLRDSFPKILRRGVLWVYRENLSSLKKWGNEPDSWGILDSFIIIRTMFLSGSEWIGPVCMFLPLKVNFAFSSFLVQFVTPPKTGPSFLLLSLGPLDVSEQSLTMTCLLRMWVPVGIQQVKRRSWKQQHGRLVNISFWRFGSPGLPACLCLTNDEDNESEGAERNSQGSLGTSLITTCLVSLCLFPAFEGLAGCEAWACEHPNPGAKRSWKTDEGTAFKQYCFL